MITLSIHLQRTYCISDHFKTRKKGSPTTTLIRKFLSQSILRLIINELQAYPCFITLLRHYRLGILPSTSEKKTFYEIEFQSIRFIKNKKCRLKHYHISLYFITLFRYFAKSSDNLIHDHPIHTHLKQIIY